jgi:hypothetical protein
MSDNLTVGQLLEILKGKALEQEVVLVKIDYSLNTCYFYRNASEISFPVQASDFKEYEPDYENKIFIEFN